MGLFNALAALAALAQGDSPTPVKIQVLEASFVQQDLSGGMLRVTPTTRIKYAPGTSCYSWILRVVPYQASVTIRERFKLPARATQWNSDPGATTVSRRGNVASTELKESLDDGMLTNGWCVVEGDPTGKHVIEVYHDGRMLHRFRFIVTEETH